MIRRFFPLFFLLLTNCGSNTSWRLDSISTGEASFDSSRLSYQSPASHLKIEFLNISDEIRGFISLSQYRVTPSKDNPHAVEVTITIDGESQSALLPLRAGKMRIGLTDEITSQIILALQEGKEVVILLNGDSATISPLSFGDFYGEFLKKRTTFSNFFKGPFE